MMVVQCRTDYAQIHREITGVEKWTTLRQFQRALRIVKSIKEEKNTNQYPTILVWCCLRNISRDI